MELTIKLVGSDEVELTTELAGSIEALLMIVVAPLELTMELTGSIEVV